MASVRTWLRNDPTLLGVSLLQILVSAPLALATYAVLDYGFDLSFDRAFWFAVLVGITSSVSTRSALNRHQRRVGDD